ncbi:MAG: hypothetical protein QXJ21_07375 [Thermofilum sp.]
MKWCSISEKTLELNVCCHIVEDLKRGGIRPAYIEGYTLRHEGILGLDVTIKTPPSTQLLSLQFKKPLKCFNLYNSRGCIFLINNNRFFDQHLLLTLHGLALKMLGKHFSLFYALPLVCNTPELERKVDILLRHTAFVNVLDIPFVDFHPCELYVFPNSRSVIFRCSERREVRLYTWENIVKEIRWMAVTAEDLQRVAEISYEELEEALASYLREHVEPDALRSIVRHLRKKRMAQLVTAIALGREEGSREEFRKP